MSVTNHFEIKEYYEGGIFVNKVSINDTPTPGISPKFTQTLEISYDEIQPLIEILKDYADKRRN